ncbi:hypothetical protein R3P38DRAFT_2772459 [Favolaschia claudopus]|uniref:Uncharacterized protein n=1 Tax=Favolaschia claudopus TaxID=2862362 RepID=A0AAW0C501_9AGAR
MTSALTAWRRLAGGSAILTALRHGWEEAPKIKGLYGIQTNFGNLLPAAGTYCPAPPPAKPAPCTIQALPRHVVLDTTKSILRQEYHGGDTLPSAIHALFSGGHGTDEHWQRKRYYFILKRHALHSRRRASLTAPRFVVLSPGARRASYMGVPLDGLWPAGCYDSAATRVLSLTMNGREKSDDGNKPVDRDIILAGEGRGRGRLDFVADGGTWRLFPISRIVY